MVQELGMMVQESGMMVQEFILALSIYMLLGHWTCLELSQATLEYPYLVRISVLDLFA